MFANGIKKYIDSKKVKDKRTQVGLLAGIVGFFSNLILAIIKFFAGWVSGSVSIMTDAINSLSDTISSILTLVGFRAASKPADKEHPYGHERSEYITGFVMSLIIMFVGFQFLLTSFDRILNPSDLHTSPLIMGLLVLSIVAKIVQGFFYQDAAQLINSTTLRAGAMDSFNDVYTTFVVLVASLIETYTGWHVDGYAGTALALFIIYNSIQTIRESIDDLLGSRPTDSELERIRNEFEKYDGILGFHDFRMHQYGPNKVFATIHIELDESWTLVQAHELLDRIEVDFQENLGIELVCHPDPIGVQNPHHNELYRQVKRILKSYSVNLKFHDFQVIEEDEDVILNFDILLPDEFKEMSQELYQQIEQDVHQQMGDYHLRIEFDHIDLLEG
ncbi:cation diffusion facilitator family transporter [Aerococcaceae bacterium WGS1372]